MEVWQKRHIIDNLVDLVENTTLNTKTEMILMSARVLAPVDLDESETVSERRGQLAATKMLYDILMTRPNSYRTIGKAAFETHQTGAFLILLTGLVKFLLQQHNIQLEEDILESILKAECHQEDILDFYIHKTDKPTLFDETLIPLPRKGIYIFRHISNRIKIDPALFKEKCPDIFVFSGVTRPQLSELASPSGTVLSTDMILQINKTARFVLLENIQDWDEIKLLASRRSTDIERSVHLFNYDETSKEYILLQSTGSSELLSKYVPTHARDKSLYVSEAQFSSDIAQSQNQNVYCICDSPGMGKTWLLENMARLLQTQCPNRMIAFIRLSEFTQRVILSPSERNFSNIQTLLEFLCPLRLMKLIIGEAIKSHKIPLELFLDGFDEITMKHLKSATDFFKRIVQSDTKVRLFVTSRPHMRKEMERIFHSIAYDIMTFTEDDRIEYLVGFWKTTGDDVETVQKLREFAVACLKMLKKSLTKKEGDLMGIPLQCYLLATVNLINARLYASRGDSRSAAEFVSPTSMNDMYCKYVKLGLDRGAKCYGSTQKEGTRPVTLEKKTKTMIDDNKDNNAAQRQILKTFHVWKALQLLYPDLADIYFQNQNMSYEEHPPDPFSSGLLQTSVASNGDNIGVTFLHRTFAEYLVAELFAEIFVGAYTFRYKVMLQEFVKVFLNEIKDVYLPVMVHFVNSRLEALDFISAPKDVALCSFGSLRITAMSSILMEVVPSGHVYIVRLTKSILCQIFPKRSVPQKLFYCSNNPSTYCGIEHSRSWREYLYTAAYNSNVAMVKELYILYGECFGEDLDVGFYPSSFAEECPLLRAINKRNYSIIEYFSTRISLHGRRLLHHVVRRTIWSTQREVKMVIDICKLLLGKCSSLLSERDSKTNHGPLFADKVHVEVIKFLVLQGADTEAISSGGDNLLMWHYRWLEKKEFCELCRFLIADGRAIHLFRPTLEQGTAPLSKVITKVDAALLEQIHKLLEVNLNVLDKEGNNMVLSSICDEGDLNVVKMLAKTGVDLHQKNTFGQGALHLAAQCGNIEFANYFLSKGHSLEDQDGKGNTPLHSSYKHLEMVKYLISQNANIHANNENGDNIAHLAAHRRYDWSDKVIGYLATLKNASALFQARNEMVNTPIDMLYKSGYFSATKEFEGRLNVNRDLSPETELHLLLLAIKSGQPMNTCKRLTEKGANPLLDDTVNHIAVHNVMSDGNLEAVQYMIALGLPLDCRDEEGNTPLLVAAHYKNTKISKLLMSTTTDHVVVNNENDNFAHKLGPYFATKSFFIEKCPNLLKERNKAGRTPLHEWISVQAKLDASTTETVLKISREDINTVDTSGQTIFLSAVANRYTKDVLNTLLRFGADPRRRYTNGQNVLHITAANDDCSLYNYLESLEISTNQVDDNGNTPLLLAVKHGLHRVKTFITPKTDLLVRNSEGQNICHLANLGYKTNYEFQLAISYLLQLTQGSDLFKMTDDKGQTPLHHWIDNRLKNCSLTERIASEILQQSGVDMQKVDKNSNTMFLSAVNECHLWVVKTLIQYGSNPNDVNIGGDNALHLVVRRCWDGIDSNAKLRFLLSIGCNENHKNGEGYTPLQLAMALQKQNLLSQSKFQMITRVLENAQTEQISSA